MSYPRWYIKCKKCGIEFYSNLRGPASDIKGTPLAITCPKGHAEAYVGGDLIFRMEEGTH